MNGNVYSSPPMEIAFQVINKIITRLVTETVRVSNDQYVTVVYAGTQDGHVLKLVQKKKEDKFLHLTSWILEETIQDKSAVRNLVLAPV